MKPSTVVSRDTLTELLYQQEEPIRIYLQFCGVETQEIDEVLQEVLLTAWRKIHTLHNLEQFPAWIRVIARRRACRHSQQMKRYWQRNYPLSYYEEECQKTGLPLPDELVYREVENFKETDLYDLVMELGTLASSILILHYVYKEKFEEIARTLGMSSGTVRSIASRSRKKLKEKIEGAFNGQSDIRLESEK